MNRRIKIIEYVAGDKTYVCQEREEININDPRFWAGVLIPVLGWLLILPEFFFYYTSYHKFEMAAFKNIEEAKAFIDEAIERDKKEKSDEILMKEIAKSIKTSRTVFKITFLRYP